MQPVLQLEPNEDLIMPWPRATLQGNPKPRVPAPIFDVCRETLNIQNTRDKRSFFVLKKNTFTHVRFDELIMTDRVTLRVTLPDEGKS